jgi:hypothetical protein
MVKMILAFMFVWALSHGSIQLWSSLNGKEKLSVVKQASYGLALAVVVLAILSFIVIVF